MKQEQVDEEVWSTIRYLDPDEQEKDKETTVASVIATVAILIIVGSVWFLLWLRVN